MSKIIIHPTIISILKFIQTEDSNGSWLEWLEEIELGESSLDIQYITDTLSNWYDETKEDKYMIRINALNNLTK